MRKGEWKKNLEKQSEKKVYKLAKEKNLKRTVGYCLVTCDIQYIFFWINSFFTSGVFFRWFWQVEYTCYKQLNIENNGFWFYFSFFYPYSLLCEWKKMLIFARV